MGASLKIQPGPALDTNQPRPKIRIALACALKLLPARPAPAQWPPLRRSGH
jgi:hypothetical protein